MSYHAPIFRNLVMSGLGSMGHLSGVNDRVDDGDEVTFRFRPGPNVTGPKGLQLVRKLGELLVESRGFKQPEYQDWGGGADRGLLVVRAETTNSNFTLQQFANMMPPLAARAAREAGHPVTFVSALNEDHDEAFAQTPGGGDPSTIATGPLAGLTADQVTQYNLLSQQLDRNLREVPRIFGTAAPQMSWKDVSEFNFRRVLVAAVHNTTPWIIATRCVCLYANAQNVKSLARVPDLMRAKNRGSYQAAALLDDILRGLNEATRDVALICAKFMEYVPSLSVNGLGGYGARSVRHTGSTGLGDGGLITIPAAIAALTAAQIVAIAAGIALIIIALVGAWLMLRTKTEKAVEFCKAQEETTGVKCTPAQLRAIYDRQPPDAQEALANALNKMGESAATAVKVLLIGASVLGLGYIGYKLFGGTKAMQSLGETASAASQKIKMSVSSARDSARARMGGGAASARRLTASSESFNT